MFCKLEVDKKTFEYLRYYLHEWREHHDLAQIDLEITKKEIEDHIASHNYQDQRSHEVLKWIQENGQAFRSYLNTIKIALLAYHITEHDTTDIAWEDFCKLQGRLNEVKEDLLDTVLVEKVNQVPML